MPGLRDIGTIPDAPAKPQSFLGKLFGYNDSEPAPPAISPPPGVFPDVGADELRATALQSRPLNPIETKGLQGRFGNALDPSVIRAAKTPELRGERALFVDPNFSPTVVFRGDNDAFFANHLPHEATHVWQNLSPSANHFEGPAHAGYDFRRWGNKAGFDTLGVDEQAEAMQARDPRATAYVRSHPANVDSGYLAEGPFLDSIRSAQKSGLNNIKRTK